MTELHEMVDWIGDRNTDAVGYSAVFPHSCHQLTDFLNGLRAGKSAFQPAKSSKEMAAEKGFKIMPLPGVDNG
jgi:hypothetical protein